MNKDFSELVEYLDEKFVKIDKKFDGIDEKFVKIDKKFDGIDTKFEEINSKIDRIEDKFDKKFDQILTAIDRLTNLIEIYHQEQVAIKAKIDIHEKWILQLAEKLGLKLEY